MDVATTLKEFREQHGLEQEELARLLETTQQTVSNWEKGTMPRAGALRRINHLLNTYRKGEDLEPLPPKPVFSHGVVAVHDIPVKPETETRQQVAESLVKAVSQKPSGAISAGAIAGLLGGAMACVAGAAGVSGSPDLGYWMNEHAKHKEALLHLTDCMDRTVDATLNGQVEHGGLVLQVDYLSHKVCAEIRTRLDLNTVEKALYRLMTLREVFKLKNTPREHYVVLFILQQGGAADSKALTQVSKHAALHDVNVFIASSVEDVANILGVLEKGDVEDIDVPNTD